MLLQRMLALEILWMGQTVLDERKCLSTFRFPFRSVLKSCQSLGSRNSLHGILSAEDPDASIPFTTDCPAAYSILGPSTLYKGRPSLRLHLSLALSLYFLYAVSWVEDSSPQANKGGAKKTPHALHYQYQHITVANTAHPRPLSR